MHVAGGRLDIRLFRREPAVRTLGPGIRAVLWGQGCSLRCPGCLAPESSDPSGGEAVSVEAVSVESLAERVLGCAGIEGLTLSGGEPFDQAAALCARLDHVRARRDLGFMAFTGHTLERLEKHETAQARALLGAGRAVRGRTCSCSCSCSCSARAVLGFGNASRWRSGTME